LHVNSVNPWVRRKILVDALAVYRVMLPMKTSAGPGSTAGQSTSYPPFYGKERVLHNGILFGAVEIPDGTTMPEIYARLKKFCSQAAVYEPTAAE